ncbi:prepilin peptidase [Escherichia coli]|nr:prepilin peptidase [Escherichia coli]
MITFLQTHQMIFMVFSFITGTVVTSFSCLAAERLPHQLKWRDNPKPDYNIIYPPSSCNNCGERIKSLYLIPIVGYFLTKGKCQKCNYIIPLRYPALEFIGGIGCVFILYYFGFDSKGIMAAVLYLVLIFLALIDIYEHWLPAIVTYPVFWIGLIFSPFEYISEVRVIGAAVSFFVMYMSMVITGFIKKEDVFAGGDVALVTAGGAWIGLYKVPEFILFTAVIFILYAFPMRLKGLKYAPMGPALAIGLMVCLF